MNFPNLRRVLGGLLVYCFVGAISVVPLEGRAALFTRANAVGRLATNEWATPTGQLLTPAGTQVELPGMRPQVLAFSPDHKFLVTAGKSNGIAIIDIARASVITNVSFSTNRNEPKPQPKPEEDKDQIAPDTTEDPAAHATSEATNSTSTASADAGGEHVSGSSTNAVSGSRTNSSGTNRFGGRFGFRGRGGGGTNAAQMSFTGLAFAPDGKTIYASVAGGSVRAFPVSGTSVGMPQSISLPELRGGRSRRDIPTGLAVSDDSKRLYVLGSVGNKLHEIDVESGKGLRSFDTGVAPFEVVLVNGKAFVSNLGGRKPAQGDTKASAGRSTSVRVDGRRFIPNEGSISVIDLALGTNTAEIIVGLHPSAMVLSPDKKYLVVANTGSDTLSVIDTRTDRVVEKIWARQTPADLFGAQPNALAFDKRGKRLFVCNGTQNAVAVVQFDPADNASKVVGLIPVGWFPGAVQYDAARDLICVANIKGIGVNRTFKVGDRIKLATKDFWGTVSLIKMPSNKELAGMTQLALRNMRYAKLADVHLPPRAGQAARPIPERAGEPSVFKHVIYVIKENRSYDQVLGDLSEGNGDTNLCTFGEKYTPNQHKLAREFVLLDNTYCAGVQSADGHQWTDSAIANEYVERQLTSGFPRSYPGAKVEDGIDALAWSSSGFIWDNALAHGKSFRNYGEWLISEAGWLHKSQHGKTNVSWRDFYADYLTGSTQTVLKCKPGIETLRRYSKLDSVGWDLHVPDVMRAAEFIKELRQYEAADHYPQLVMLFLPNDHTGGAKERYPTPGAQIADNDLAFGQVVEAVSHSRFWKETCIIAIEDDPQAGWDHVSGYRTTCYMASPYTKRRQTISTQYNQLSVVRTIELILGLPPMNQMDAVATPFFDCFMDTPDLTPFTSVPNQIALDTINPPAKKVTNSVLRADAYMSAKLKLDEPDQCDEDTLNQILWRSVKGPDAPYPRWAAKRVDDDD